MPGLIVMALLYLMVWVDGRTPPFVLPEDLYHHYGNRAEEFSKEAQLCLEVKDHFAYNSRKQCEKDAQARAEFYKEMYNTQLFVRISRALNITGNSEWFLDAYNAQKLD